MYIYIYLYNIYIYIIYIYIFLDIQFQESERPTSESVEFFDAMDTATAGGKAPKSSHKIRGDVCSRSCQISASQRELTCKKGWKQKTAESDRISVKI